MFADRIEAGRRLATALEAYRDKNVVVVGLPRGGVPVAAEVARALGAPLDVIVVRKLGVPFQPELAMGAIGEDGVRVLNDDIVRLAHITEAELAHVDQRERSELERRARRFRGPMARIDLAGRTVIVVDDGIATGSTAKAACRVARAHGATKVVLAVPVAPVGWTERIGRDADEFVCVETPDGFYAVGQFYRDFSATTDDEVVRCLAAARAAPVEAGPSSYGSPAQRESDVDVHTGGVTLPGHLTVPVSARGIVVFAHGSGSSRHSSRNRYVASVLNDAGLATLLFDLLSGAEESVRANVFDIELLAERLAGATRWLRGETDLATLPVAYFGASTGAAAALWAASMIAPATKADATTGASHVADGSADRASEVAAIVSRGGRPDLAGNRLGLVRAPTLLIVGGRDDVVLELNRRAQAQLTCENELAVVPGASHLFEEPGTLPAAAQLARDWFTTHLG